MYIYICGASTFDRFTREPMAKYHGLLEHNDLYIARVMAEVVRRWSVDLKNAESCMAYPNYYLLPDHGFNSIIPLVFVNYID